MEASANWAVHQVQKDTGLLFDDFSSYATRLDEFYDDSASELYRTDGFIREYGGFVVAEWLQHRAQFAGSPSPSAAVIRDSWERISPSVAPHQAWDAVLLGGFGAAQIAQMWQDLYFLDFNDGSMGTTVVDQTTTSDWRRVAQMTVGGVFTPERGPVTWSTTLGAGEIAQKTFTIGPAGAVVAEVAFPSGSPPFIEVTGGQVQATMLPLRSYDVDTAAGPDLCSPPTTLSGGTIEFTGSALPDDCAGVVLLVTNPEPSPTGGRVTVDVHVEARPTADLTETIRRQDTDVASFGVGGLRDIGEGTLTVDGVSGPVEQALLVWHGPTNSTASDANADILFATRPVVGSNVGFGDDNCWGYDNSQTYVADVTGLVIGDGDYPVGGLLKDGGNINVNGVSLVVFCDDGDASNDVDSYVLFLGNDSTEGSIYEQGLGWAADLGTVTDGGGPIELQLHVADGQTFADPDVLLNGQTIAQGPQVFDGTSVPGGPGPTGNGSLWDIRSFDISDVLATGDNPMELSTAPSPSDCLSLVGASLVVGSPDTVPPNVQSQTTATVEVPADDSHGGRPPS